MKPTSEDVAKWIREAPTTYDIPSFIAEQAYKAGEAAHVDELVAGVEMPEPRVLASPLVPNLGSLFTEAQMRGYAAAAVAKKNAETALQGISDFGQMQELLAERDALTAELAKKDSYAIACQNEADALRAENERLRAACDKFSEAEMLIEQEKAEPVAYEFRMRADWLYETRALYTAPQSAAEPLTEGYIKELSEEIWGSEIDYQHLNEIEFARAIETAHGIGAKT